jgi:hypothetical protein
MWVSPDSSYALSAVIPDKLRVGELTPIPVMKAIKNPVEIQGMNILSQTCSAEIDPELNFCCHERYTYVTVHTRAHWQAIIGAFVDIFENLI